MSINNRLINTGVGGGGSFNTVLYTGDGTDNRQITGVGFSPDILWIKSRTNESNNLLFNSVLGTTKHQTTNTTSMFNTTYFDSFDSDGFTLDWVYNQNGQEYVAWCWKAGGSTTVTNTDGTITSQVSANVDSGISIVKYTGAINGTVGHGLGVEPSFILTKNMINSNLSATYHKDLGNTSTIRLEVALQQSNYTNFWGAPGVTNSSVFGISPGQYDGNVYQTLLAPCFAEVAGFSKFGTYAGNGSPSGIEITTDFEPAFVMVKAYSVPSNSEYYSWTVFDNKRNMTGNVTTNPLFANQVWLEGKRGNGDVSSGALQLEFLTNGFKLLNNAAEYNSGQASYVYMAFANQF